MSVQAMLDTSIQPHPYPNLVLTAFTNIDMQYIIIGEMVNMRYDIESGDSDSA